MFLLDVDRVNDLRFRERHHAHETSEYSYECWNCWTSYGGNVRKVPVEPASHCESSKTLKATAVEQSAPVDSTVEGGVIRKRLDIAFFEQAIEVIGIGASYLRQAVTINLERVEFVLGSRAILDLVHFI